MMGRFLTWPPFLNFGAPSFLVLGVYGEEFVLVRRRDLERLLEEIRLLKSAVEEEIRLYRSGTSKRSARASRGG